MDYNDYSLNKRMKAINEADEEASHFHTVEGWVICRYPVTITYDDRMYDDNDLELLIEEQAEKDFGDGIYHFIDDIEII